MEIIQVARVFKTGRGEHYLVKESRGEKGEVLAYELLDFTPISPSSQYYDMYKKILGEWISPRVSTQQILEQWA